MNITIIKDKISELTNRFRHLKLVLLLVVVALAYCFIVLRGVQLNHASLNKAKSTSQSNNISNPQIDPAIINKINQLQDNSVNVQSLFNQARQNPFQE